MKKRQSSNEDKTKAARIHLLLHMSNHSLHASIPKTLNISNVEIRVSFSYFTRK